MPQRSMAELEDLVGWRGPAFTVELEQGRVEDFAEAVFDDDPVFSDPAEARSRGLPAPPVPVTLFGSIFYRNLDVHEPELGFDVANTLHGEQEFSFERTPTVGETLYGRTELTDIYQKDRSDGGTITFAELATKYHDVDGELVLTAKKTRLEVVDE